MPTKIEWCDETINPIRTADGGWHCTKISPGCANCYAEGINNRFGNHKPYDGARPKLALNLSQFEKLSQRPCRVFIQSMSDLFHEDVPFDMVDDVAAAMVRHSRHTYLWLTKRPERMWDYYRHLPRDPTPGYAEIHLGVTAENQQAANRRIPVLLDIPAAVRFVSVEPMLGPVDLTKYLKLEPTEGPSLEPFGLSGPFKHRLAWVVCGAETGPGKRRMDLDWARSLRDQCADAGVPFFFKKDSDGNHALDGVIHEALPETQ